MAENVENLVPLTVRLEYDLHRRLTLLVRGMEDSGKPEASLNSQINAAVRIYLSGEISPCSFPDATNLEAKKLSNYLRFLRSADPAPLNLVEMAIRKLQGLRAP